MGEKLTERIKMKSIQGAQIQRAILTKEQQAEHKKSVFGRFALSGIGAEKSTGQGRDSLELGDTVMELLNPTCGMSSEEKQAYEAQIRQKIENGKKLSSEELRFLQMEDPMLYAQVARVQAMRESMEQQLNQCRSKQEAEEVYSFGVMHIGEKDPMKEAIAAAYDDVMKEFKKTQDYQSLPAKEEDIPGQE